MEHGEEQQLSAMMCNKRGDIVARDRGFIAVFGLRLPPPLVVLGCALLMVLLSGQSGGQYPPLLPLLAAGVLVALGAIIGLLALLAFWQHATTVNPHQPQHTSALVTGGIYRFSRNPMYLGLLCWLIAWACWLSSFWSLLGPIVFVVYMTWLQILPEEQHLAVRFGTDYLDYQQRVRRWL